MKTMTCSHGFGAADNNPPAGGIPVIEMEAELVVVMVVWVGPARVGTTRL